MKIKTITLLLCSALISFGHSIDVSVGLNRTDDVTKTLPETQLIRKNIGINPQNVMPPHYTHTEKRPLNLDKTNSTLDNLKDGFIMLIDEKRVHKTANKSLKSLKNFHIKEEADELKNILTKKDNKEEEFNIEILN